MAVEKRGFTTFKILKPITHVLGNLVEEKNWSQQWLLPEIMVAFLVNKKSIPSMHTFCITYPLIKFKGGMQLRQG